MTIDNICALEKIKTLKDNSQDLIFADPPYALGSTVLIGKDGKPYYKEAKDFMNSWEMPDEKFWKEFYIECMRVLKYGGRVLFFGIDRQLFLFQYYAIASGLEMKQSLYWYFLTNFPKSTDLAKNIDKRLGVDREVLGTRNDFAMDGIKRNTNTHQNHVKSVEEKTSQKYGYKENSSWDVDVTKSNTELGKKYEGLKYSISPLKQVCEEISVYQKETPFKLSYGIFATRQLKEVVECIIMIIKKKEEALGTIVCSVERDFIFHLTGKYLRSGNHTALISADLIEEINVNNVEKSFTHRLQMLVSSVQESAIINQWKDLEEKTTHSGQVEDLKEKMDILLLETQKTCSNTHLSIELLWLIISVESLEAMKMFTTSMSNEMITELKTLNSLHMENILQLHIINQNIKEPKHILKLAVNTATENFTNIIKTLKKLKEISAVESTGTNSLEAKKQKVETIMVFQKPTKNKSVLDDVFAYEDGDDEISVSAWSIDGGRVPVGQNDKEFENNFTANRKNSKTYDIDSSQSYQLGMKQNSGVPNDGGRFPSQLFIDKECADKLDEQSGIKVSSDSVRKNKKDGDICYGAFKQIDSKGHKDSGGASKILHKIGYLDEELDLLIYDSKVSTWEREYGCDGFEKQDKVYNGTCSEPSKNIKGFEDRLTAEPTKNTHTTLKPIKLIYNIAKLLKTPTPQTVFFPFSGARSEVIGFEQAGFNPSLFSGSEISKEYNNIGIARQKAWKKIDINNLESVKKHESKTKDEHKSQGSLFE